MKNLAAAFVKAQQSFPAIPKDGTGNFGRHATLHTIMEKVLPVLNEHGLVLMQHPTTLEGQPALRTKLIHAESGECEEDTMLLVLDKNNSQGQGSALTYARRYAVLSTLGLVADEDDDGQAASKPAPKRAAPAARAPDLSELDVLTSEYAAILEKPRGTVLEKLTEKFPNWRTDRAQTNEAVGHLKKLIAEKAAA